MKKIYQHLSSYVFLLLVFGLLLLFVVLPKQEYSANEKRVLSDFPAVSAQAVFDGSFFSSFETYLSDHFPLRNAFIGMNAYYQQLLGNNGSTGVYKGDDGYLILKPEKLNEERLARNVRYFCDFAEKNNLNAALLTVPTAGGVLTDCLPAVHEEYVDDAAFEIIKNSLNGRMPFVDMRDAFRSSQEQVYYRTDHHITSAGSYLCYTALCETLGLQPTPRSDFLVQTSENFYGTTYSKSGLWLTKPDTVEIWHDPALQAKVYVSEDGSEDWEHNGLFYENHLQEDDQYPVFLDGNHGYVHIHNEAAEGGKLLIIKDSYAHCMTCFLSAHYKDIYMIDMRYYKLALSALVQEHAIDTVLYIYGLDNLMTDSNIAWLE